MGIKNINSGYLPFVQREQVTSPFTDIVNRAKVDASLKCIFGNERIHVNSLNLLTKEQGPNGEPVYEPDNGDSRVRFVNNNSSNYGSGGNAIFISANNWCEVTFYGTGLSMLLRDHSISVFLTTVQASAIVDGASIGTFYTTTSHSPILDARNYKPLAIAPVTKNLTLGWHTIRIDQVADTLAIQGFEIINEASQITVRSGKAHGNGYEYSLDSDQLIDYNLGFDNVADGAIGTKGGRSIVYLDPTNGTVKKRLTVTDATPLYLTSTNHVNEAPYRKINFREFGRNRADDFSTLSTARNAAFTLDDGTTTLVGNDVSSTNKNIGGGAAFFLTLTFVGTGLDIVGNSASVFDNLPMGLVYVDGVSTGSNWLRTGNQQKICSGLSYGTHTVKFTNTVGSFSGTMSDFIVYQPKKPTLPAGAIEIGDYNIMADYVAATSGTIGFVGSGVLRKTNQREMTYVGAGWGVDSAPDPISLETSLDISTGVATDYYEYTFFGTGVSVTGLAQTGAVSNFTISIDGSSDLSGFTTSLEQTVSGPTFTAATGVYTGTPASQSKYRIEISSLTL